MDKDAAQIIRETIYAAVATSSKDGMPWNSPVYVVYDASLNFYWASGVASQHSCNIQSNPQVCMVIYDSNAAWGAGRGVFVQAEATEVNDIDEIDTACELRKSRVPDAKHPPGDFVGDRPRRIYRATPKKIWVNHGGKIHGFFVDRRTEVDIASLREILARPAIDSESPADPNDLILGI